MIIMYDTITNSSYPDNLAAAAAYVDGGIGDQPNFAAVSAAHPRAHLLSIALSAANNAECLDMETGAARYTDFPGWYARQRKRGVTRPCGYASVSAMAAQLLPVLARAGIARGSVRLWSAHTGQGPHICGPASCGEIPVDVDGTQWTFNALGRNLDQSQLLDTFFGPAVPVPPVPPWQEAMMQALPVLKQGATGPMVLAVQGLCAAVHGIALTVDGNFGPITTLAVKTVQLEAHIAQDGIVGPATWPPLLGIG